MKHATRNTKLITFMFVLFFVSCFMFYDSAMAQVKLETGLPNIPAAGLTPGQELPSYIRYLFIFGLSLVAFLALTQMMIGGLTYILAAGNVADKIAAKDTIKQALIGLGLLLVSYLLLNTINPDLVNLRNPNLTPTQFKVTTMEQVNLVTQQYSGPYANAEAGKSCSPNGAMSPGLLVCQNSQWTVTAAP
ncbi:MAG: hypothetical protein NTV77_00730 [Candidatus Azambacteria bacterium]|nr:hypothetical protein [Candidatus Azambacteria bacterium]